MTVYDLCSAPGGKAIYAAELMQNKGSITALEMYESKLRFINENAQRCKVSIIKPVHGDAREFTPDHEADLVMDTLQR
jgi:16S rRNA (cytosine967-C5)-methyltransferase